MSEREVEELLEWARKEKLGANPKRLTIIYDEARKRFAQHYTRHRIGILLEKVLREL